MINYFAKSRLSFICVAKEKNFEKLTIKGNDIAYECNVKIYHGT